MPTGETPVQFYKNLKQHIYNIHIKDYKIIKSGAIGAKLLGSGGGGFFLIYCKKNKQKKLKKKLNNCNFIDFNFSTEGSRTIYLKN